MLITIIIIIIIILVDLSASLCFNCALYNVEILDPCIFNSSHFLSFNSKTQSVVINQVLRDENVVVCSMRSMLSRHVTGPLLGNEWRSALWLFACLQTCLSAII